MKTIKSYSPLPSFHLKENKKEIKTEMININNESKENINQHNKEIHIDQEEIVTERRYSNLSIILDSYDDIFSDFDPRPFSSRTVSDDFLEECKKRVRGLQDYKDSGEKIWRLILPKNKRNKEYEPEILERLQRHFQRGFQKKRKKFNYLRMKGVIWIVVGWLILGVELLIQQYIQLSCTSPNSFSTWVFSIFNVFLQPAGWFFEWEGFGHLFFRAKEGVKDLNFYKIMSKLQLIFVSFVEKEKESHEKN